LRIKTHVFYNFFSKKINMQKIKKIILAKKNLKRDFFLVSLALLSAVSFVKAGNLNSPGSPSSTGYSLEDIYQRLTTNASVEEGSHSFTPAGDPAGSFHTLTELYEAIPTVLPETVKLGTSYLGVGGNLAPNGGSASASDVFFGSTANLTDDWELDTGTLTLACATDTFDGTGNKVENGYDGNGDGNNRWCVTDSGDVVANEIILGKKAWVDGIEIVGNMSEIGAQTIVPGTGDQSISEGYHDGTGTVSGDEDLVAANIKSGINIFGIEGDSLVVNTGSGTAVGSQILAGEKAWVDGSEIMGTLTNVGQEIIVPGALSQTIPEGYHDGTGMVNGDVDLVAGNIKAGTNIFGVAGDFASQEKTATDEGEEVTPDSGKWLSKVVVAITNLLPGNIKKGMTVGGVEGTLEAGYLGTGWVAEISGDASESLNEANCAAASDWEWFEDANGDGDTSDPGDGICVKTSAVGSDSWNGAEQVTPNNLGTTALPISVTGGNANSVTVSGASWTADAYKNHIVKVRSGTANNCWGKVKTNTSDTITVYGSWLTTTYASGCGTPDGTSGFVVYDDLGQFDNSFIGDYSCAGNYPNGTVSHGNYPPSGVAALAVVDCYDGRRDLLPNEEDRAVISGTATSADATSVTDTTQALDVNVWLGQKVLITNGAGAGSYGFIESNTATQIVVSDWLGGADPEAGSEFKIIYIVPHGSYNPDAQLSGGNDDAKGNNGPLMAEVLADWKGTRLPSAGDFFGFCGYKDGGSNYESTTGANTENKSFGNYGGQNGRSDEFMDLASSGSWEWLSEQLNYHSARLAGVSACSNFYGYHVNTGNRFRGVFRP
jgi:hypothetical protein